MIRNYLPVAMAALFVLPAIAHAQCLMEPVPLESRIDAARTIVEGSVVASEAFEDGGRIYTRHLIDISRLFKGSPTSSRIELITEGGRVGGRMEVVTPSLRLAVGDAGIFMVEDGGRSLASAPGLAPQGSPQMFIRYDMERGTASDPFARYASIEKELYRRIVRRTGSSYKTLTPLGPATGGGGGGKERELLGSPVGAITMSPNPIAAGTHDTLTITGSGFGSAIGSVRFMNADDGGDSWIVAPSDHIVSWSDTKIRLMVPDQAGSGPVQIKGVLTGESLVIPYSITAINTGRLEIPYLTDMNGIGGYTYTPNSGFRGNSAAMAAFVRALRSWRCASGVNFNIGLGTTSIGDRAYDGVNLVSFVGSLGTGVRGRSVGYLVNCSDAGGKERWYMEENDLIFSTTTDGGWNFGPEATSGGQLDFESVVVHELGHSLRLGHVIDQSHVMNWKMKSGADLRELDPTSDVPGGLRSMAYSLTFPGCDTVSPMIAVKPGACALGSPVAGFSASATSGCAPLTVSFADTSANAPLSWKWDINNDGRTDYTVAEPTHTFTLPGTYSVKLTVENSFGTNSVVRTGLITVLPPVTVRAGADLDLCAGESRELGGQPASAGGSGSFTYAWAPAAGLSDSTIPHPIATPAVTTEYILTVTDAAGCQQSDTVMVRVNDLPERPTIVRDGPLLIAVSAPASYQWMRNDTLLDGANQQTYRPVVSAAYSVAIETSAGCGAVSEPFNYLLDVLGVDDVAGPAGALHISPNPFGGEAVLHYELPRRSHVTILLCDLLGREVRRLVDGERSGGSGSVTIDGEGLPAGVYLCKVMVGDRVWTQTAVRL